MFTIELSEVYINFLKMFTHTKMSRKDLKIYESKLNQEDYDSFMPYRMGLVFDGGDNLELTGLGKMILNQIK